MPLMFIPSTYEGGRILARTGQVDVGAVFPQRDGSAKWAFWLGGHVVTHVKARSVLAAKSALIGRFQDWLRLADLMEVTP